MMYSKSEEELMRRAEEKASENDFRWRQKCRQWHQRIICMALFGCIVGSLSSWWFSRDIGNFGYLMMGISGLLSGATIAFLSRGTIVGIVVFPILQMFALIALSGFGHDPAESTDTRHGLLAMCGSVMLWVLIGAFMGAWSKDE